MTLRTRQRGAALMAMLVVVIMGGAWWLVSGLKAAGNRTAVDRTYNAKVLAEAKAALIAWAAMNAADLTDHFPGSLPCPEGAAWIAQSGIPNTANTEGIAAPGTQQGITVATCSSVGRLPWRTLGIPKLVDAAGEPLWYVVDASAAGWARPTSGTNLSINSNKAGTLTVDGAANAAVAVIIAPGAPMTVTPNANQIAAGCATRTQQRTPSAPDVRDYLECYSTASPLNVRTQVVDNSSNLVSNDQMVVITAAEVLAAVEPVVAQRIQKQVVPQLQTVYASTDWGTSATAPLFPFAVPYPTSGKFDAAASDLKGTNGTTEGLLPLTTDTAFVQWNAAATQITKAAGSAGAAVSGTCTGTTTLVCTVNLGCTNIDLIILGIELCLPGTATFDLKAYAQNVGMSLRTFNNGYTVTEGTSPAVALTGLTKVSPLSPLQSDGSARIEFRGTVVYNTFCLRNLLVCSSKTVTIETPVTSIFPTHPFLSPVKGTDNWYWFVANNWHHVTYYKIAGPNKPGGTGSCTTWGANCTGTPGVNSCICFTAQGGSAVINSRAVLALAGRSVNNTSGTSRTLADFLDSTENTNADLKFEQYKSNRTFNDRFVSLSP